MSRTCRNTGIPVTYAYIEAAHEGTLSGNAFGPGQKGYENNLQAFNAGFAKFFARLQRDGITTANTLFVITADEGDHFVGGTPEPAGCNGVTTICSYDKIGEIDANLNGILAVEQGITTPFQLHYDDAPNFYVNGNPSPDAMVTRNLEVANGKVTAFDTYVGYNVSLTQLMANPTEENILHMVTADPARTPTFTSFDNPDFYVLNGATSCNGGCTSVYPPEAWNHGDYQSKITTTWLGLVGPGIKHLGRTDSVWCSHTDIRPTILTLVGLKDDYVHEGHALAEFMTEAALPQAIVASGGSIVSLAQVYTKINSPVGPLGLATLKISTRATEGSNTQYQLLNTQLQCINTQRNSLDNKIISLLEGAEFHGQKIDAAAAQKLVHDSWALLDAVHDLAQ